MITALIFAAAEHPSPAGGISLTSAQIVIGILGTLGIGSVLAAVVTGIFSRKKLGADATEIITKAAAGVVERTEADNARLRADLNTERAAREADRREFRNLIDSHTRTLQLHASWDAMAVAKLAEVGIELPAPPPLYAPETAPSALKANPQVP